MTAATTPGAGDSAAAAVLASAAASGVQRLWFTSGSELTSFQEAAARARHAGEPTPEIVTCPHEHVALTAAMGDTMVSGRPAMTAAHADLGLLHHGGAIHNAMWGDHPVLIMSGYPPTRAESRTSPVFWKQQRWDQGSIVRQYVKWDYKLSALDDPGLIVARGLQVALAPRRGPVYLAVPEEVGRHPVPATGRVPSAQALGVPVLGPGDAGVVSEVARRLTTARRPVIVTDRVGEYPRAVALLAELADSLGVEVRATRYRMNLPDDSPWRSTAPLDEFDVVVVLDHPVPWMPAMEQPRDDAWIGWVGPDPIESRVPLHELRADARTTADPAAFLAAVLGEVGGAGASDADQVRRRRQRPPVDAAARPETSGVPAAGMPTPALIAAALDRHLSPDDLLTWEVFDTATVTRTKPGTLFEKGGSSLGWSVAAATGASIASGGAHAVAVTGDGSYLFGSPDSCLWLQQQHDAPVVTVVVNNGGYRTGTTTLAAHYPGGLAAAEPTVIGGHLTPSPDFAAHARSQGCYGERVVRAADLAAALDRARTAVERHRVPAVLDVWVPEHLTGSMDPGRRERARTTTEGSNDG
ncbi:thiamine pyrophosphate-dependent enzyme [Micromonospora sp. NPDC005299]|uniref:thiamine pyrophosphate-dependent enzyme n=1 Tax=Micromonospora sp. NPDC005299 TaxID=3364231 RepID=UPI00368E5B45